MILLSWSYQFLKDGVHRAFFLCFCVGLQEIFALQYLSLKKQRLKRFKYLKKDDKMDFKEQQ